MEEEYMKLLKDMAKDICQIKEKILVSGDLVDNETICCLLKISKKTLRRYREQGLIPFYKIKGKCYYEAEEVKKALKNKYYGS